MADDDLTLTVGGASLSGWTDVEVTVGIEGMPNKFAISLTEKYPGAADAFVAQTGDACSVMLGADLTITGYVDRYNARLSADQHTVNIIGRSKSEDFVDSSAEWPGGQIKGNSAKDIIQKLANPYGITVKAEADVGPAIPQFNLTLGETGYAIAERICRYRGLLIYDQPDGSILLAQAGNGTMASGIKQGVNSQVVEGAYAMDERFSTYRSFLQSVSTFDDTGSGGNLLFTAMDPGVKRHRQRDIIAEAGGGGRDVAKLRAQWECNRRAGRGYTVSAVVDSWRDSKGKLWTPNYKIPIDAPAAKVPAYDWLIGSVTFRKGDQGTQAELTCMPKQAFLPEPILLQPLPADVPPQ